MMGLLCKINARITRLRAAVWSSIIGHTVNVNRKPEK